MFTAEIYGSGNISFDGTDARIYEVSLVDADQPILTGPYSTDQSPGNGFTRLNNRSTTLTSGQADTVGVRLPRFGRYMVTVWCRQNYGPLKSAMGTWLVTFSSNVGNTNAANAHRVSTLLGAVTTSGGASGLTLSAPTFDGDIFATGTWDSGTGVEYTYDVTQIA